MKKRIFIFIILLLLPVFAFASVIKIPNSQSPAGSEIRIPIVVEDADSLAGAQIVILFDANLLIPIRTETTGLTAGFILVDSISTNKIAISLASATGLPDGNGPLVNVIFKIPDSVTPGDNTSIMLQKVFLFNENTETIPVTSQNGVFSVSEAAFVYPNIFTPNGDGFNDYAQFIIPQEFLGSAEVLVFHSANKLVKSLLPENSNGFKWDGKDENGNAMEPGVYIYLIKTNGEYYSNGTVTLMR